MKWKTVVAIIIGLLIVSSGLKPAIAKSFSFKPHSIGVYDPHPTFNDDLKDAVPVSAYLHIDIRGGTGSLEGKLFIRHEVIQIKKRFSLVQSNVFNGYVMIFNNNPSDKLTGLQGNVYTNGTIFLFFKDKHGGLLFISMYNPSIPSKLSKLSIPSKNVSENEWLWKLGPTVIKTKTITKTVGKPVTLYDSSKSVNSMSAMVSSSWLSSTLVTKWFEVGWWIFKTKYFITLEFRVYGPPSLTSLSPQGTYQVEVEIYNEGTESGSEDTPLLIGDSAQVGPEAVEMGMVVPEECDRIMPITHHSASHYALTLGDVGLSFGFALGPLSLDPITAISLVFSGGLNEDIKPTHPVNAIHIKYNDMYALHPGEYIGTKQIVVNYEYQQYSGVKPFKVKFKVPVYYQLSASQGLQQVGVIEGVVYHYVNHNNTS